MNNPTLNNDEITFHGHTYSASDTYKLWKYLDDNKDRLKAPMPDKFLTEDGQYTVASRYYSRRGEPILLFYDDNGEAMWQLRSERTKEFIAWLVAHQEAGAFDE